MPFTNPRVHRMRTMTAESRAEPNGFTLTFEQQGPFGGVIGQPIAELEVYLTDDQDAADAYMLAAAINASQSSYDSSERRRERAAIALGWRPTVHPKSGELTGWERPWREGDPDDDNPQHVDIVIRALVQDLDIISGEHF